MTKTRNIFLIFALATLGWAGPGQVQVTEDGRVSPAPNPSLNFYGVPGLIDMPSAEALPDGQFAVTVSSFAGQTRTTLSFQAFPRVTASFRYIGLQDYDFGGFSTFRDRSFDVRFLLAREGKYRPALALGLQDFAGTGIYSGEYIVATKTLDNPLRLPGRFRLTAGLGWGRFGTSGDIGSPFSETRPGFVTGDTGGSPQVDSWFRGPASPFGGIEWNATDRFGFKVEYSPDAYVVETTRGILTQDSRLNFGAEYQYNERLRFGGYWLYGREAGISAQLQFNPMQSPAPLAISGPRPIIVRPSRDVNPSAWSTDWAASAESAATIRDALVPELTEEGLTLEALSVTATTAELRISNDRYQNTSLAIGRAARVMARILPPSVETFRITPMQNGLALSTVVIQRRALESLEFEANATEQLLAATDFEDAEARLPQATRIDTLYPQFSWSFGPYIAPSYFDPDQPVRVDVGLSAAFEYIPAPGWTIAGEARARLFGDIEDGRQSNSVLPRVRTDAVLYAGATDLPLTSLYVSRNWKPGKSTYARVTAGYLESMYGGVSAELLWKPQDSKLALGAEVNYARQRDFDQALGFRDYDIVTGHLSAYYEFGGGYFGQIDAGRYLAGDDGATFSLSRRFDNGWKVGGFFTLTDVSAEEFGEGSFDKGINLTIPVNWFTGRSSQQTVSTTVRPIQRDGGARLSVPGRLYEQVRAGHQNDVVSTWSRAWQ